MQLRVYLPATDERPSQCGLRFCSKDKRWERNGSFKMQDAQDLAAQLGVSVELSVGGSTAPHLVEPEV